MALRDLALTVLELEPNEYHWVLMEAMQAESEDCLGYKPVDSSTRGLSDYTEALIQGSTALRVLQGLAPGSPKSVSVADDIGDDEDEDEDQGPRDIRNVDNGTSMARLPSSTRRETSADSHHTSMLTTIASQL